MTIDYEWLKDRRKNVTEAERDYNDAVADELPLGTLVEYQHGDYWLGPYEVTGYGGVRNAGHVFIKNLKTGKTREVWVQNVRLAPGEGS